MANADAGKDKDIVKRRHCEWKEHKTRWRWLLDSLEGGDRYRDAIYGYDGRAVPRRNLIRHKREYPQQNESGFTSFDATSAEATATDDDYELRRARTPVPTFVAEAIDAHLGRIYRSEIEREGPTNLTEWWLDVDGCGTPIDSWMADSVAPLLLVSGQLDILIDHPRKPDGAEVKTQADVNSLGIDSAVAKYILPENMVWWSLNDDRTYAECLVQECGEDTAEKPNYRHWTATESTLYDPNGKVLETIPHQFGVVPIVRVFTRRKPRCVNVGQSRYEGIAERQREYYNRDSELILSDTTQAHPLLQGPEDYVQSDGTIPIGPSWLLPKKKNNQGGTASYEGFEVVDFPKGGADSIRMNLDRIREDVDRDAHLTKPAGAAGTTGKTVAQSGISKRLDTQGGNDVLSKVAAALEGAELSIAKLALTVLNNAVPDDAATKSISVDYPRDFDLFSADELAVAITEFQGILAASGQAPEIESDLLCRLVRLMLPGLDDDEYDEYDAEIDAVLKSKASITDMAKEAELTGHAAATAQNQLVADDPQSASTDDGNPFDA